MRRVGSCRQFTTRTLKPFPSAREMACAEVIHGHLDLTHRIEVAEADGSIVDTVWFRDVVDVGD
jgi:hypothetical protein